MSVLFERSDGYFERNVILVEFTYFAESNLNKYTLKSSIGKTQIIKKLRGKMELISKAMFYRRERARERSNFQL